MRSAVVLLCLVVGACGESRATDPETPAGSVETLTGDVTATRAGVTRPLAPKGDVWGDDTVTTGPGASVGIRLSHNGVLWTLEAGLTRRVDQGIAWRAPKQSGDGTLDRAEQDRTAAAGRHAEQEAAETGGTAAPPPPAIEETKTARATEEEVRRAEEAKAEEELRKAEAEKQALEQDLARREGETRATRPKTAAPKKKSVPGGGPIDLGADPNDPLGGGLDGETGGGARAGDSGGGLGGVGTKGGGSSGGATAKTKVQLTIQVQRDDGADATAERRVLQAAQAQLRYCVEQQLARDPSSRQGSVSWRIMLTDAGQAVAVNPHAGGEGFDAGALSCAVQRVRRLVFPAKPAHTVLVTLRFKAE